MFQIVKSLALVCLCLTVAFGVNLPTNCGKSTASEPDWRIVGGSRAAKGEFPWQIMLNRLFRDPNTGLEMMELCGGSIINEQWVLTAAHCVAGGSDASEYSVKLAVTDMSGTGGYKSMVEKVIHHESFKMNEQTGYIVNDIALVKLDGKLDFNKHKDLEPVCLATLSSSLTKSCIVSGYGYTHWNGNTNQGTQATTLMKVSEPIAVDTHCSRIYPYYNPTQNVCAGGRSAGGTGTCMGDSGGPLVCKGDDGKFHQVGVVSYGMPCALPNDADVFTKVANYVDWIKETIDNN